METKLSIVQFLFTKEWKVLSDSLNYAPALPFNHIASAPDLLKFCTSDPCCLVLVNISSKEDLIQLATFAKTAKRTLKGNILKIVAVNMTENKGFEKAINKLGPYEVLDPNINVKALRFKIDFWARALKGQAKKAAAFANKNSDNSMSEQADKGLNQMPALDCESDMWILNRESDCKRIIGRWMVKLMGPSPHVGSWNEVPNKKNVWTFQIKKSFADYFVSGEGNWLFKGEQKPEFNWQENRWMFTGDGYELFFFDGKVHSRLKLENKVMSIAANSAFAKTKEQLIIETFDKEFVFKKTGENISDPSLEFENEGDLGGNLEGKIKEKEEAKKGHLEGKVKEQEEKKGNLEGKIKEKEEAKKGHLEGQVKEQEEKKGNLEGKIKDKEEAKKGHLEGKVKDKEEEKEGQLQGKVKEQEEKKGNLEGIVKELEGAKGPLKGKLKEAEEKSASERDKKTAQREEAKAADKNDFDQHNEKLSNRWGGKVTDYSASEKAKEEEDFKPKKDLTDHLDGHWGGKGGAEAVSTRGKSGPGTEAHKDGSLLDLKKSEKEHQTHYKNHNEAAQYEADGTKKNQYQNGQQGSMGGKTETDHLASHYGSKNFATRKPEEKKGSMEGEHETERVSTHMGGRKNRTTDAQDDSSEENKSSPLAGKGKTDKLKGHYGSGKRPEGATGQKEKFSEGHDFEREDFDDVLGELEGTLKPKSDDFDLGDLGKEADILPFLNKKSEEKELDQITENAVVSSYIIQGKNKFECKLDDYFENNVILLSKSDGLQNSEAATLDIKMDYRGETAQIDCQGMVMSLDEDGNGGFFISVEIAAEDAPMFDEFMNLLRERQESIDTFLKKVKGLG